MDEARVSRVRILSRRAREFEWKSPQGTCCKRACQNPHRAPKLHPQGTIGARTSRGAQRYFPVIPSAARNPSFDLATPRSGEIPHYEGSVRNDECAGLRNRGRQNRPARSWTGRRRSEGVGVVYWALGVATASGAVLAKTNGTLMVLSRRVSMPLFTGRSISLPLRATT